MEVMKLRTLITLLTLNFALGSQVVSQNIDYHTIAVLNIDAQGFSLDPGQMGNITRIELLKLDLYEVVDRHEIEYIMEENGIDPNHCYNKACLIDVGKKLNAGKVLTGSVEILGDKILINYRLIDVQKGTVTNTEVMEFLNIPDQVNNMIEVTLQNMFNKKVDYDLMNKLTKEYDYNSAVNVSGAESLNLNGPRMGVIVFTGDAATLMQLDVDKGGFGLAPVMFQFGYQFEVQYLSAGDFQALFEFLPLVTGLDQGLFIPSITFLHGLRSNKTGFELAFGPSLAVSKINVKAEPTINASFVFGIGKTFKSGRLNFPINFFFLPGKNGHRYGLSVGFNVVSYDDRQ
jgi:TolB-like protein